MWYVNLVLSINLIKKRLGSMLKNLVCYIKSFVKSSKKKVNVVDVVSESPTIYRIDGVFLNGEKDFALVFAKTEEEATFIVLFNQAKIFNNPVGLWSMEIRRARPEDKGYPVDLIDA